MNCLNNYTAFFGCGRTGSRLMGSLKVMNFDRFEKKVRNFDMLTDFDRLVPKKYLCRNTFKKRNAVSTLVLTPFVPFSDDLVRLICIGMYLSLSLYIYIYIYIHTHTYTY